MEKQKDRRQKNNEIRNDRETERHKNNEIRNNRETERQNKELWITYHNSTESFVERIKGHRHTNYFLSPLGIFHQKSIDDPAY